MAMLSTVYYPETRTGTQEVLILLPLSHRFGLVSRKFLNSTVFSSAQETSEVATAFLRLERYTFLDYMTTEFNGRQDTHYLRQNGIMFRM